jgi:ribosomal protein S18 acetylase RimI-like enzyme
MMKIDIHLAEIENLNSLVAIYKSAFLKHNIFCKSSADILAYLEESHKDNLMFGGGYLVAKVNDTVVGGILVRKKEDIWKLNHLAVKKEFRRQGIATQLVKRALEIIKGLCTNLTIKISVSEDEKGLISFYEKFGFKLEQTLKDYYRPGEEVYVLSMNNLQKPL